METITAQFKKESLKEYLADKEGTETQFQIEYEYKREGNNCSIILCEVNPVEDHEMSVEEIQESVKILLTDWRPGEQDNWTMDCEIKVSEYEYSGPIEVTY